MKEDWLNTTISPMVPQCGTTPIYWVWALYTLLLVCIAASGAVGNSLVVLAVVMARQLRRKVTMYFIVSLAISDLVLALTQIPFKISTKLNGGFCHTTGACYTMMMADALGNIASILNLLLIAVDRFVAVTRPFHYSELITSRRAKQLVAVVWTISLVWCLLGIFRWDGDHALSIMIDQNMCQNKNYLYYMTSYFALYVPSLVTMTTTYLKILHVAIGHIQAIEATTPTSQLLSADKRIKAKRKSKFTRELKATKSVAFVYLAFLVCWLPSCVINVIIFSDNKYFPALKQSDPVLFNFLFYAFVDILPVMNTMVNPLIYSFSNRQFLSAFKSVIYQLTFRRKSLVRKKKQECMSIAETPSPVLRSRIINNNEKESSC